MTKIDDDRVIPKTVWFRDEMPQLSGSETVATAQATALQAATPSRAQLPPARVHLRLIEGEGVPADRPFWHPSLGDLHDDVDYGIVFEVPDDAVRSFNVGEVPAEQQASANVVIRGPWRWRQ